MSCGHLRSAEDLPLPVDPLGCADCLADGRTDWVHLRQCLSCGRIGCCDSSPGRHATRHATATSHPVMRSAEPGEQWRWCFVHETLG
jgi:CPA1 family monovalent cation:H+ antiporter